MLATEENEEERFDAAAKTATRSYGKGGAVGDGVGAAQNLLDCGEQFFSSNRRKAPLRLRTQRRTRRVRSGYRLGAGGSPRLRLRLLPVVSLLVVLLSMACTRLGTTETCCSSICLLSRSFGCLDEAAALVGVVSLPLRSNTHNLSPFPVDDSPSRPRVPTVALFMGRKKGSGRLANLVDLAGSVDGPTKGSTAKSAKSPFQSDERWNGTTKGPATSPAKVGKSDKSAAAVRITGGISPLLAQWAEEKEVPASASSLTSSVRVPNASVSLPAASPRRQRQLQRREINRCRERSVQQLVQRMEAMFNGGTDKNSESKNAKKATSSFQVEDLLQLLTELLRINGGASSSENFQLRQLLVGSRASYSYRLAWVGSDDALCHIGTGLHKVRLARLQEVFLILGPNSHLQMYEVIRIIGPFPNIKNTLLGTGSVDKTKSQEPLSRTRRILNNNDPDSNAVTVQPWRITWNSMIDGTGKEILAGTQVRTVNLDILWSDPSLLVCAAARSNEDEKGDRGNRLPLFHDEGKDLLVFVRETEVENKLNALRVI